MWLLALMLTALSGFLDANPVDIKCPRSGHYVHVRPLTGCTEYYTCNNGVKHVSTCPQDTIYSSKEKMCKASGHCHELVCTGRIDGRYVDPIENCSRIYKCRGGSLMYVHTCAKDGARCSGIQREHKCPHLDYSAALVTKKHDICEARQNGYHTLKNCSSYVQCSEGKEMSYHVCPNGQKFNGLDCVDNYKCESVCTSRINGLHPDVSSGCREYVNCKGQHVVSRHRCPSGNVFDGKSCITSYECPTVKKCDNKQNGRYSDYSRGCSSYFDCYNGEVVESNCPNETVFNGSSCVSKTQFYCQSSALSMDCFGRKGFFRQTTSNCKEYYFCDLGKKTVFRCPDGEVFDGKACVIQSQFQCPEDKKATCEGKALGYYQDFESNCRSYYFCFKGNKITYVCPEGDVFNGEECVSTALYTCPYVDNECASKSDGYHVREINKKEYVYCKNGAKLITLKCGSNKDSICNFASNSENVCSQVKKGYITDLTCRIYQTCLNFVLIESGTCKETQVFNGKTCVSKNTHQCLAQQDSCKKLMNGFYQDFNSGCKKYFFCINGEKTELSCPENQIHNGNICVHKLAYTCPQPSLSDKNMIHFT